MTTRDHGGDLDRAASVYGGALERWIDQSTGINPRPYPVPDVPSTDWQRLPLARDLDVLLATAHQVWGVPKGIEIVAAPGASALIAAIPHVLDGTAVTIEEPTYNEHRAAFEASGWTIGANAATRVIVHPNNPDGRTWDRDVADSAKQLIIDESFCDTMPEASLVELANRPGTILLKSFGKFWGLAGLRLGFAICLPETAIKLRTMMGPWALSGPAIRIGQAALSDEDWARATRDRLSKDTARLDQMLAKAGLDIVGGTSLFRLARSRDALSVHERLAKHHIWTRIFPANPEWIRFGLPGDHPGWDRLADALGSSK